MPTRNRSPLLLAVLVAALAVMAQALLVPLFAAPAANLAPRDLPVAVAGPAPAVAELAGRLAAARPGAFSLTTLPDAAAADRALRDREVYGAFVIGTDGLALHTASAASPTVAALLTEAVGQVGEGRPVTVVEVVPTTTDDPRGAGFAAGFLPLAMTSLLAGALLVLLVAGGLARLVGLVATGLLAGLVGVTVLHGWLGVIAGNWLAEGAAIGLFALAASAVVTGLGALLGRPGIGLGALLVFLLGNPLSAVGAAPELLPQPWGALGQWLPVGAGGTLLRSVAFFDGAGAGRPIAVLAGYSVVGLALVLVASRMHRDASTTNGR
ncbi:MULTISPECIES: hypothetical protein [unclassified Micromonospora]|uniref:hypothetical protein n=1 Tax=unclassified Micromonospora TaxID=2617518 RepID=UPI0022B5FB5A|nr:MULTISPECIES: hypothetical protein [unclassified Micromonospora]MCZ7420969.1 hypothetical protein [Verrucosispora sp. WMMA2121]WBB94364.1 hypothetical protein O7597_16105 [Verrucosispora sp. WMMC514]